MRIKPVEFVVRNGWVNLKDLARYFDCSKSTIYRWAVWRKTYPKGFPKADRIGQQWMVKWALIQKWESGLMTYQEMKDKGITTGRPGHVDYSDIFDYQ